jgi:hypothetical protein
MRILIVRLSALGDIVHALPVLAAIKKAMPSAESTGWSGGTARRSCRCLRFASTCDRARDDAFRVCGRGVVYGRQGTQCGVISAVAALRRRARSAGADQVVDLGKRQARRV